MKDKLTVLVTTHILPTAPSIQIIKECTDSIFDNFKGINECNILIYCDSRDSVTSQQYLDNLSTLKNVKIIDRPHSGMRSNYQHAIENCQTDYFFFCEHDWLFLRPVEIKKLIYCMDKNPNINFVRFNKRNNWKVDDANDAWETHIEEEDQIKECSLMRTNCVATHPHIVRKKKFVEEWLPFIDNVQGGWSIELSLYVVYTSAIRLLGFQEAQKRWGIFNYGSKKEANIITHLDGSDSGRI